MPALGKLASIWIAVLSVIASAQQNGPISPRLNLPYGPITRLASPDGSRILYGVAYQNGVNEGPQLWIEDTRAHRREKLLSIGGTLSAGWSADGSAFTVQDSRASDSTRSYIYATNTLQRLDLARTILGADPGAERFASGHAYFDLDRWDGTQRVLIHFHGHTDEAPVVCFDFRYRVSRTGSVEKLSQREFPVDRKEGCKQ